MRHFIIQQNASLFFLLEHPVSIEKTLSTSSALKKNIFHNSGVDVLRLYRHKNWSAIHLLKGRGFAAQKNAKYLQQVVRRQSDQIGRIFAHWVTFWSG
jgi:hypothetical protein